MPQPTKDAKTISIHVPRWLADELDTLAQQRGMRRSSLSSLILQDWFQSGCPPVTEHEKTLIAAEERAKYELRKEQARISKEKGATAPGIEKIS